MSKIKNGDIMQAELSLRQIAEILDVHYNTVMKLLERRELQSKKLCDVLRLLKEYTIQRYEKEKV